MPAIAGGAGRIGALGDDPFHFQGAGMVVEGLAMPDLMIAEVQGRASTGQQTTKALLPLLKRPRAKGFAVEVKEIEQEKDESGAVTGIGPRKVC